MAASSPAAAAAPPLLPTPPSTGRPAPFHFPSLSSRRHTSSPASPALSTSKKPGRASASESWVRDKEARADLAPPPSMGRVNWGKIAGRASLTEDWVIDKIAGTAAAGAPARSGCSKRPLLDSSAGKKRPRYDSIPSAEDSDSDSELEFYAGPAFLNAPPPSALPIPCFALRKRPPNPRAAVSTDEVSEGLGLHDLWNKIWHLQRTCTLCGEGLSDGLD